MRASWSRVRRAVRPWTGLVIVALVATLALAVGCTATTTTTTAAGTTDTTAAAVPGGSFPVTVMDDFGTEVTVEAMPERIVSTAPANTEMLFALGVGDRVVGVTSLDDYPPEVAGIDKIGDFTPNTEAIIALSPDLVVGYAGNEEALQPLRDQGVPVLILNPATVEGIYANIKTIGDVTGVPEAATTLIADLRTEIEGIANSAKDSGETPKVFYALDDTLWTVGPGSFVDELLTLAAAENVAAAGPSAYFQYTPEELVAADPDIVLLPQTVFPSIEAFSADPRFAALRAVKEGKVALIDDTTVTRPGPRVGQGLKIVAAALHPGVF